MSSKGISRREFLRLSAVGVGATVLAACTTAPPASVTQEEAAPQQAAAETKVDAPAEGPVEITWWHAWGGTGMEALTKVEETFNAKDSNIKVLRTQVSEMNDKLLTAIAGGTAPNIGTCCVPYAQLYAREVVIPLDEFIDASTTVSRDEFVPGLLDGMIWQGKTYGVPAVESGPRYGFIYNTDLTEEAGLDADNPPQTWDEMYDWHVALTKFDDAGNVEQVGFDPRDATAGNGPLTNIPMFWAVSYGFEVWDKENLTFHFDDDRFIAALGTIKRFYDHVGVEKMQSFRDSFGTWTSSPTASFPSGVQANIVTGYYAPGEMSNTAPDLNYTVTWAPRPEERRDVKFQSIGGHPLYIPVGTEHVDEAWTFIEYMLTDEVAEIIYDITGWLPGRKKFYDPEVLDVARYAGLDWYLQSVNEANEFWSGPVIPIDAFVNQERNRTYDAVVFGDKTPEEAAIDMQQSVTDELQKQFPELVS